MLYLAFGGFDFGGFEEPVIYSITIEGGKSIGGLSQVPKKDEKATMAPPKKVQEPEAPEKKAEPEKKEETKAETPPDEKAEVSLVEKKEPKKEEVRPQKVEPKKVEPKKEEPKKKEEKKKEIPKKDPGSAERDKRLQDAVQRYLGESTDAGGKGFGAAKVGGSGMGGGIQRPPEYFTYRKLLEDRIKSGWRWYDSNATLITQIEFYVKPDGTIDNVSVLQGSGNREFDDSVMRALQKANPVPPPPATINSFLNPVRMAFDPRE